MKYKNVVIILIIVLLLIIAILYTIFKLDKTKIVKNTYKEVKIDEISKNEQKYIVVVLNKKTKTNEKLEKSDTTVITEEDDNKEKGAIVEDKKEKKTQTVGENKNSYYIKINVLANVVNVYAKDDNGDYTLPYKAFVCSTGTATPHNRNI